MPEAELSAGCNDVARDRVAVLVEGVCAVELAVEVEVRSERCRRRRRTPASPPPRSARVGRAPRGKSAGCHYCRRGLQRVRSVSAAGGPVFEPATLPPPRACCLRTARSGTWKSRSSSSPRIPDAREWSLRPPRSVAAKCAPTSRPWQRCPAGCTAAVHRPPQSR